MKKSVLLSLWKQVYVVIWMSQIMSYEFSKANSQIWKCKFRPRGERSRKWNSIWNFWNSLEEIRYFVGKNKSNEKVHQAFMNRCLHFSRLNVKNVDEEFFSSYFAEEFQKLTFLTLWSLYSMFKPIKAFKQITFMKKKYITYKTKM